MTHTVETRIKLSIHRYASRFSTLYIDENLLSVRKIFAAPLRTSYLKYALMIVTKAKNCEEIHNLKKYIIVKNIKN